MKFTNEQDKERFESAVAANISTIVQKGFEDKYNHGGIYCIKLDNKVVYVGKSRNMLQRIAQHMAEIDMNDKKNMYNVLRELRDSHHLSFDVIQDVDGPNEELIDGVLGKSEAIWIQLYNPCLNIQHPHLDNYMKYDYCGRAKTITAKEIEEILVNNI